MKFPDKRFVFILVYLGAESDDHLCICRLTYNTGSTGTLGLMITYFLLAMKLKKSFASSTSCFVTLNSTATA